MVLLLTTTLACSTAGCTAGAGSSGGTDSAGATAAAEPASSAPAAPPGTLGPTEQPELPVTDGKIGDTVKLTTGLSVHINTATATRVEAETPGDVAGPAVAVNFTVTNQSAEPQSVDSAVVTLEAEDGELGIPTIAGNPSPLHGELAPEASAEATYLFMLDPAADRDVTISINYAAGEPVAQFTGRTQ